MRVFYKHIFSRLVVYSIIFFGMDAINIIFYF